MTLTEAAMKPDDLNLKKDKPDFLKEVEENREWYEQNARYIKRWFIALLVFLAIFLVGLAFQETSLILFIPLGAGGGLVSLYQLIYHTFFAKPDRLIDVIRNRFDHFGYL